MAASIAPACLSDGCLRASGAAGSKAAVGAQREARLRAFAATMSAAKMRAIGERRAISSAIMPTPPRPTIISEPLSAQIPLGLADGADRR